MLQAFAERCLSIVDVDAIRPLKVVLDGANGMAGTMMAPILDRLPVEAERCHFDPDGTFPHYQPNPLLEENREFIIGEVKRAGADLGIAWTATPTAASSSTTRASSCPATSSRHSCQSMLAKQPGETILYDLRASRAVPDIVERAGGTAIASRVGHAFIKHRLRKENAIFAGEVSGHYYFRDFYNVDTGIVPALVVLELVSRSGKKLSELLAPLHERYHLSGEINSTVGDVPLKLQELKERYGDRGEGGRITHLDGVSVDFDDWHFNVRASNTEPLLRLNLEAYTAEEMERRRDEVLGIIRS